MGAAGKIERTLFMLDRLENPELRQRCHAGYRCDIFGCRLGQSGVMLPDNGFFGLEIGYSEHSSSDIAF